MLDAEPRSARHLAARALAILAVCVLPVFASGCDKPKPLSVIVLLDSTSFADAYWDDSLAVAERVAGEMGSRDRIQVNAIDDCSGEDSDVLAGPVTLSPAAVWAKGEAAALVKEIRALDRPAVKGKGTDIVGALREASDTLTASIHTPPGSPDREYRPIVVICSDMRPDLRDPESVYAAHPFTFPEGTRVRCMFVVKETEETAEAKSRTGETGTGLSVGESPDVQRRKLVTWWASFLTRAGVTVSEKDFKKVEESKMDGRGNTRALLDFIRDVRFAKQGR